MKSSYAKAKVLTLLPILLMGLMLSPLPCLLMPAIGTVFAAKAKKEGTAEARKFFVLSIVESLACVAGVIIAAFMFTDGSGV